jgi:hypothetical protein
VPPAVACSASRARGKKAHHEQDAHPGRHN